MTKQQIIAFKERTTDEKIRAAYDAGDLVGAMQLVHITMGIDNVKASCTKVLGMCFDLVRRE